MKHPKLILNSKMITKVDVPSDLIKTTIANR